MVGLIFIFGLVVGSFLNAYIWRLHVGKSVWSGRSQCPKCKRQLHWHELIPLVSFVVQGGRCRGCRQQIDWQYPIVELTTGILFTLAYQKFFSSSVLQFFSLIVAFYLLSVLVILFVFDLRYGLVPDKVVLPAIVVALLYAIVLRPNLLAIGYVLVATIVGAAFFAAQYYFSRGRWLGEGDIRIGALMGAMVGWPLIFESLIVAYLVGGIFGILLLVTGRKRFGQTLPLGTFLTFGTAITFLYGQQIWQWYWY